MPSSQSFLLYVLQPTVVDTQQICGKRDKRRKLIRDCQDCIPSWFLLRICCLSTITAKQHFVTDCLKSLNLRWTHHLPNCWNAICVLLHCWVFCLFVWLAFWRGKFGKGTYTKVITHPHCLFIITYEKKLAELRME